jgi:hypothetical protein
VNYCEGNNPIIIVADILIGQAKITKDSMPEYTPE